MPGHSGPNPFHHWEHFRTPYHPGMFRGYYGGPPRFRLFQRLFWFGLGAGVYAIWHRHDQWHEWHDKRPIEGAFPNADAQEQRRGHCASHWGWRRHQQQQQQQQPGWTAGQPQVWPAQPDQQPSSAPQPAPSYAPAAPAYNASMASENQPASAPRADVAANNWNTDHIRDAGRHASDAFVDISESALDSLLTNIQTLKKKLADARAERENENARLEQRNQPEAEPKRLV